MAGGSVQNFNWRYIELKYGTFEGHDFYFTNREAFGGATSMWGMLLANPHLVLRIVIRNLMGLGSAMMADIWVPNMGIRFIEYLFKFALLAGVIYGAFRSSHNWPTKILLFGSLALVGITVISIPKVLHVPHDPRIHHGCVLVWGYTYSSPKEVISKHEKLFQKIAIAIFDWDIIAAFLFY